MEIVPVNGREFILIGTAHISQESTDLVRAVIEQEKPDVVCVELDEQRYKTLSEKTKWENLDLKQIIRQRQLMTLLVNLLLMRMVQTDWPLGLLQGHAKLELGAVGQERAGENRWA